MPPAVRNALAARAAEAGQSLQEYMLGHTTELARRPTNAEIVVRMRQRVAATGSTVSSADIVDIGRAERDRE